MWFCVDRHMEWNTGERDTGGGWVLRGLVNGGGGGVESGLLAICKAEWKRMKFKRRDEGVLLHLHPESSQA